MAPVLIEKFDSYSKTIPLILEKAGLAELIQNEKQILIKPNLTTNLPPPVTTPCALVREVVLFCQKKSRAKIVIAEGSGGCETELAFSELGFRQLAQELQIELLDLNRAPRRIQKRVDALVLKRVALPQIAFESFIINLAVLKEHSAAKMTAAMKNLFGFYLNKTWLFRRILGGPWWNKSELHFLGVSRAIVDLYHYLQPDFNLVDASIGQLQHEIHGQPAQPPLGKIIAGKEAKAVDRVCAPLLGLSVDAIDYLA